MESVVVVSTKIPVISTNTLSGLPISNTLSASHAGSFRLTLAGTAGHICPRQVFVNSVATRFVNSVIVMSFILHPVVVRTDSFLNGQVCPRGQEKRQETHQLQDLFAL